MGRTLDDAVDRMIDLNGWDEYISDDKRGAITDLFDDMCDDEDVERLIEYSFVDTTSLEITELSSIVPHLGKKLNKYEAELPEEIHQNEKYTITAAKAILNGSRANLFQDTERQVKSEITGTRWWTRRFIGRAYRIAGLDILELADLDEKNHQTFCEDALHFFKKEKDIEKDQGYTPFFLVDVNIGRAYRALSKSADELMNLTKAAECYEDSLEKEKMKAAIKNRTLRVDILQEAVDLYKRLSILDPKNDHYKERCTAHQKELEDLQPKTIIEDGIKYRLLGTNNPEDL